MCLVAADVPGWSGQECYVGFYLGSDWAPVPTRFSLSQRLGYLGAQCAQAGLSAPLCIGPSGSHSVLRAFNFSFYRLHVRLEIISLAPMLQFQLAGLGMDGGGAYSTTNLVRTHGFRGGCQEPLLVSQFSPKMKASTVQAFLDFL